MASRQTLDQFIHEALGNEQNGKCTAIALMHIVAGQQEKEIHTQKLGTTAWNPKELADMFRMKAENHAGEIPGMQTFNLLVFYENRGEPQARRPFSVYGGHPGVDGAQLMTEAPTPQGLMQQMMRHNEAHMQIALRHTAVMVEQSATMMARMATMNERLMTENNEAYTIIRELMVTRDQAQGDNRMKELEYSRKTKEREMLGKYLPALANQLTGRELFPQSTSDTALIETMAEAVSEMSEEQMMELAAKIPSNIWAPLAARFTKAIKEKNREAVVRREAGNGADPDQDFQ
jgi:hypothetical protein